MLWVMAARSDMVDVNDVVNVVVLQHDFFAADQRLIADGIQGVEGSPEIGIGGLVAEALRRPVEAELHEATHLFQNFHIADVVAGARLPRYAKT